MPDKTPAAPLTGVELCERVALGMKWVKHPRRDDGMWLCDSKDADRSVVHGKHRWISPHSDSPCLESWFRPDIDCNHLAEVKAFLHGTMLLGWMVGVAPRGEYAHAVIWLPEFDDNGDQKAVREEGDTEALAFLRAFVAASDAEKEKIQ